ncbi:hypothetical protein HO133_004345 [Letharia lupina]|uniref:Uncharacterized protein n=1 Tax=Letharia lupina TaxID=560253 RepID=A0A8H6FK82_9LECA|nr:uncharacterized protein HO133_004345 [Letharia lupina]KAF6230007.1 hypothetical protein HO133_004345 [Letharia lupina]
MSSEPIVSHGRGGAGNIEHDEKAYTDGEIVREGALGDQGDGPYSSGRGGAGNMESPSLKPRKGSAMPGDDDVVPETAMRPEPAYENFHTGRGGEGNVHRDRPAGHEHEGLKEKAKHLFGGGKKEGGGEGGGVRG